MRRSGRIASKTKLLIILVVARHSGRITSKTKLLIILSMIIINYSVDTDK